jgi:hypothetical protein
VVIMLRLCDEPTLTLCDFCNKYGGEMADEREARVITAASGGSERRVPHCATP